MVTPAGANWMGTLDYYVVQLVQGTAGTLVPFGYLLLAIFTVSGLGLIVFRSGLSTLSFFRHVPTDLQHEVVLLIFQSATAAMMLQFYATPIPGTHTSLHQLLPLIGSLLTNTINTSMVGSVLMEVAHLIKGMQKPAALNVLEACVYLEIFIDMALLEFAIFCLTAFGAVALGVFTMFGPVTIPFFATRNFTGIFWGWVENMAGYSLYAPIGAAISYVFCGVLTSFFHNSVHGNYSLGWLLALVPVMIALSASFVYAIFAGVPSFAARLTRGAGDMGQAATYAVIRLVTGGMKG